MTQHWMDPRSRGLWDHPAASPPTPRPRESNDLASRVSQLEVHQQWATHNAARVEHESRLRARDLADWQDTSDERQESLSARVLLLEQDKAFVMSGLRILSTWGGKLLRYAIVGLLALLMASGYADVNKWKAVLALLSGSSG